MKRPKILIVRTDRIGDVVMITPMIRELRHAFPDAFIATLTQPEASDIFLHNPNVNASITDDLRQETFRNVVKELRQHAFTDGLLVMPTKRAAYQMFLAGIKNRIGVGHIFYEVLTFMKGVSRKKYIPLRHEADYCMDLARKIGVTTQDLQPEIFVTEEERANASYILKQFGVKPEQKIIFIHTGSGGSSSNWSEGKYALLIDRVIKEYPDAGVKIVLTAREMSYQLRSELKVLPHQRIIDISQSYKSLRELITLIAHANVVVSSSTGPLHLADALNVGCVGLFCHRPMNCSTLWGVFNPRSINLEVADDYCNTNCSADKEICAFENGITIDRVMESINKLLAG
jgi:ADP-heptose:LPS heptosyltransferase